MPADCPPAACCRQFRSCRCERWRPSQRLSPGAITPRACACKQVRNMSTEEMEQPFDSIESAQDFMNVLAVTILDAMKDLNSQQQNALRDGRKREAQAFELALFKLKMLSCYVHKSRRTLNDLRMIRRLVSNERLTVEQVIATM